MINSLTLFPKSIDAERLDDLLSRLISSMKQANGLLKLSVNEGPLMSPGGPSSYSKVLEASWESLEEFMAWTQASAAQQDDKDFLIDNGAILIFYEVNDL
jgi:hypothetical protein